METEHNRVLWINSLHAKFAKALENATMDFTWQEKSDFLETLIHYVEKLKKKDGDLEDFFTEKIMKPFKARMRAITKENLLKFFWQEFAFIELGVIPIETFNSLPYEKQGMDDGEFEAYLGSMIRYLKSQMYFHYAFEYKEEEKQDDTVEGIGISTKGRIQRSADDLLTKLNQEQTALLIDYLKKARIILRDEYLNDKTAGTAFSILTGYSPNNLRIKLGEKEISKIRTKTNLKELDNVLTALKLLISNDLKVV